MIQRAVVLLMLSALVLGAQEAEKNRSRLWSWSLAAVAAANAADIISARGRYELNPVLGAGPFGLRATGVKIGISSATIGLEYLIVRRRPDAARKAAVVNFGLAGFTGAVAAHNAFQLRMGAQSR